MQVCKSKAQTSFLSFSLVLRCTNVHNEGAAFYLEDTKRGNIVKQTERRLAVGLKHTVGLWETELDEYFSSISFLLSSQLQFSKPWREIHTNTSAYTQILCTHRDLHTKDMDQNFPFFSRKCAKNYFKDLKKNFTVQLYITNSFKHFP